MSDKVEFTQCEPLNKEGYLFYTPPEKSAYTWEIMNFGYNPLKKDEPNWFRRKMMELFFGGKWVKK